MWLPRFRFLCIATAIVDCVSFSHAQSSQIEFTGVISATVGAATQLQWTGGSSGDSITLVLEDATTVADLVEVTVIASNIPNTGSYSWTPSSTLSTSTSYAIKISDGDIVNYSEVFKISAAAGSASNGHTTTTTSSSSSTVPSTSTSLSLASDGITSTTLDSSSSTPLPEHTGESSPQLTASTTSQQKGSSSPTASPTTSKNSSSSPSAQQTSQISTSAPNPPGQADNGLSTGAKAGIGVGIPVAVILIILGLFLYFRQRRRRQNSQGNSGVDEEKRENTNGAAEADSNAIYEAGSKMPKESVQSVPREELAGQELAGKQTGKGSELDSAAAVRGNGAALSSDAHEMDAAPAAAVYEADAPHMAPSAAKESDPTSPATAATTTRTTTATTTISSPVKAGSRYTGTLPWAADSHPIYEAESGPEIPRTEASESSPPHFGTTDAAPTVGETTAKENSTEPQHQNISTQNPQEPDVELAKLQAEQEQARRKLESLRRLHALEQQLMQAEEEENAIQDKIRKHTTSLSEKE